MQAGYGEVCRPREDIKKMVFTRLTCLENLPKGLENLRRMADPNELATRDNPYYLTDPFLLKLQRQSSSHAKLNRMYGIRPARELFEPRVSQPN